MLNETELDSKSGMPQYQVGDKVPEGYTYDPRGLAVGQAVILTQDVILKCEPFFPNVTLRKGERGVIERLDRSQGSFFNCNRDGYYPVMYRGHDIHFPVFNEIAYLQHPFTMEVEPWKLELATQEK